MRITKTIIVRLYLDTEVPERLCGDVQLQPERKPVYFQNAESLVNLLYQVSGLIDQETLLPGSSENGSYHK